MLRYEPVSHVYLVKRFVRNKKTLFHAKRRYGNDKNNDDYWKGDILYGNEVDIASFRSQDRIVYTYTKYTYVVYRFQMYYCCFYFSTY